MHEIRPGLYRGQAPLNQTAEEQKVQTEKDQESIELSDLLRANFDRKIAKNPDGDGGL